MQRFWTDATAGPVVGGFGVTLDGRPVRLPSGTPLVAPNAALAEAVAAEWQAAPSPFGYDDLPLTRLVGTAQERIAPDPSPVVDGLARYGDNDLLCYRADDVRLAAEQAEAWNPLLAWAAQGLNAALRMTTGLMPVSQPPQALAALRHAVAARSPIELAALGQIVPAFGSLVLGLAAVLDQLSAREALRLASLDETFQERFWGSDAEAVARRERIAVEVGVALQAAALDRR